MKNNPYRLYPFLLTLALSIPLCAQAIVTAPTNHQPIPKYKAEHIAPLCESGLTALNEQVANMAKLPLIEGEKRDPIFRKWNKLEMALEDLQGPLVLLMHTSPDAKLRKVIAPCLLRLTKFNTALYQNKTIYTRIKTAKPLSDQQEKLQKDLLESFENTGVSLPPEKKEKMEELIARISKLKQDFSRNIRDNPQTLTFTPEEMKGLPSNYLKSAMKDEAGNYILDFSYPSYIPFMRYAENSEARKRYQFAFTNRGTDKNIKLLEETIKLRRQMVQLFGSPTYADFVLPHRMAETPGAVNRFLSEIKKTVSAREKEELEILRAFKAETLGTKLNQTELKRWDTTYWSQKYKKTQYNIDPNNMREYFPTLISVKWVMTLASSLYNIQFKEARVPVWYNDVRYFNVFDGKTGKRIGGIYLDLFPREGKYSHAAAFGVRGASTLAHRQPASVLVTNFNRAGLDHNELETLLHEFGHVLHGVLSKTHFVDHSGTSVERDFVEAPSQMFEEWARHLEPLSILPIFCMDVCPTVDKDLLSRLKAAAQFGKGMRYARQHLYASYDMALHQYAAGSPLKIWKAMESKTPLGHVKGTQFPGAFGHLMGGYAAGYYGYMWSEVLAKDMLSQFGGKFINPEIGARYRQTILERGGERPAKMMVQDFLGREPNSKAFFDTLTTQTSAPKATEGALKTE